MKINWKVRFKNKAFCITFVAALLLLVSFVMGALGVEICNKSWWSIVNAVLIVITMVGVAIDPTTKGVSDSELVKYYTEPRVSGELENTYFVAKGAAELAGADDTEFDNQFAQVVKGRELVDDVTAATKKTEAKKSTKKKTTAKKESK